MGSYEQKEQSDYSSPNTNKTTLVRLNYSPPTLPPDTQHLVAITTLVRLV